MYVITSMNNEAYQPLADMTWDQNKKLYAEKHGYVGINWTGEFKKDVPQGFDRMLRIKHLMEEHPEYEWIWWTGCDSMITNFNIKIEDRIDNNYNLILATDCNELNNDSFLIKNCDWSKQYLQTIYDKLPIYKNHMFLEQQAMIESYLENKQFIKIVPQRYMNSYRTEMYPHQSKYDQLGTDGTWEKGDWLIHWPGTGHAGVDLRLQLARLYLPEVVQ